MKRTERVGAMIKILSGAPNKIYSLQYFCDLFGAAKSSISEDIQAASAAISFTGTGYLQTVSGAKGGVKFVPDMTLQQVQAMQDEFCRRLKDPTRLLGGNFLYTSDIFSDPAFVMEMAAAFAKKFKDCDADYVATVETKGIPLASSVAYLLNVPLVVIRREAKISEGSTVSINYFSGSYDRIQKMSMSKRAIASGSKILIIDDYMRGGGSIAGIQEMIGEFNCQVAGIGIAFVSLKPEKKRVSPYTCLVYGGDVDEDSKIMEIFPNPDIYLSE